MLLSQDLDFFLLETKEFEALLNLTTIEVDTDKRILDRVTKLVFIQCQDEIKGLGKLGNYFLR